MMLPSLRHLLTASLLAGAPIALLALPATVAAQVGSTTDILTGHVLDPAGAPVEGATVTATSAETRVNRTQRTGADGRYVIVFPDGGGQYQLVVRYIGFAPVTVGVQRQGDEDRLVTDVRLGAQVAQQLSAVEVRASTRRRGAGQGQEPGTAGRSITPEQAARLPVDQSDVNALAALAPGVVSVAGTDSTPASFSVAGQSPAQNNLTLDGVSFGSASIPQDGVRATRVITNTYDVARGQFTGGQIATTTRGGTNVVQGSASANLREPSLQFRPDLPGVYGQGYRQQQLSAGLGGPIVRDRLFLFGAGQLRYRGDPLQSLVGADAGSLERLGVSADSAERFLTSLRALGVSPGVRGVGDDRASVNASALARLDWNVTDAHTLTLRGDWRETSQDASRVGALSVPSSGGDATTSGGGVLASLTSRLGASWVHELRAYYSGDRRSAAPYVRYPAGRVRVTSALPGAARGVTTFGFGANPSLPNDGDTRAFEATDELSWLSPGGAHRVKLGALLSTSRYDQANVANGFGTFVFDSIAALEAGTPSLFTRSIAPTADAARRRGSSLNAAGYLGDTWRRSRALQVTYGVRLEGSRFGGAPAHNAALADAFGLRTDEFPSELRASPRVGFTYTHYPAEEPTSDSARQGGRRGGRQGRGGFGAGAPTLFVRGGLGEFRGRAPTQLFSNAQLGSGLPGAVLQLVCVGEGVPIPDWDAYFSGGQASVPTECANGLGGPTTQLARPGVTAFLPDFQTPRALRGSLGVTRRFWERWTATLDGQVALGRALTLVRDFNLNETPRFRLADEGDRPVFVPASAIVDSTGAAPLAASRLDPRFAQVLALGSGLRSTTQQLTASVNAFTDRGIVFSLSYTLAHVRDQSAFGGGSGGFGFSSASTGGDPNVAEWGRSDLDRRHNFIGTVTWPVKPSLELTAVGRLTSGGPYTPMVSGDVNGDGSRNDDRAFVFDPATIAASDPALADAMRRVLDGAPAAARECLRRQLGAIAGRNSCTEPWLPSLDLQLNYRPDRLGLRRRLTLSLVAINPLAGADQLLHGANDLRGWGQRSRPDATLLYVRGFDPAAQRYRYEVNERFGDTRGTAVAFRQPFQLALQGRFSYGMDNLRDRIGGALGGGGGGGVRIAIGGDGAAGAGGPAARLGSRVPNPLARILELRDTLALTPEQTARLQTLSDTLARKNDALGEEVRAMVQKAGNNPDPAALFATIRPKLNEGRANLQQALDDAKAILTPEQWAKVPEDVKNPGRGFGGGRRERVNP